jgi:undecaprenyl-diphosphatase
MAATTCLYVAIAILVIGHARGWWRYLFLIPAVVMPVLIALARLYRGEHHPTDILASVLFAALWLTATTILIKPNRDGLDRSSRRPLGLPGRKTADDGRESRAGNPLGAARRRFATRDSLEPNGCGTSSALRVSGGPPGSGKAHSAWT